MTMLLSLFSRRVLDLGGAKASTMGGLIGAPEDDVSLFF